MQPIKITIEINTERQYNLWMQFIGETSAIKMVELANAANPSAYDTPIITDFKPGEGYVLDDVYQQIIKAKENPQLS